MEAVLQIKGSLLPAIRVVSSAYLRLLIFLPAILIPACSLPSPAFCMMDSASKLNKQGDNIQLSHIQKTKILASGPITSWEIDWETVETVSDFIFGGSKITADRDCSHEIKRRLLLGRKVMTNLDSILKIRDIALPTKVRLVKAMVFPVVMYGSESWTMKKAEHRRIDAFELCYVGEDS